MPQGTMGIPRLLDSDLILGVHTASMSVLRGGGRVDELYHNSVFS